MGWTNPTSPPVIDDLFPADVHPMKISIEIDLGNHLTAEELAAQYQRQCEHAQILPESGIANLIRAALQTQKEAA